MEWKRNCSSSTSLRLKNSSYSIEVLFPQTFAIVICVSVYLDSRFSAPGVTTAPKMTSWLFGFDKVIKLPIVQRLHDTIYS